MSQRSVLRRCLQILIGLLAGCFGGAASGQDNLNIYIVSAANTMVKTVYGRGYDRKSSFTEPLSYGDAKISPTNGGKTMCVAAVAEAMIRAINAYSTEYGSSNAFEKLPISHWTKGTLTSLRAYLYQYEGTNSGGPGDALSRFGIGEKVAFDSLLPGDLLAFSRKKTGHAVVFLGYLDTNGNLLKEFDKTQVAGFRYISSQGEGLPSPYSGVGTRNAFFSGHKGPLGCARTAEDCGVLKIDAYLNAGRLWSPSQWDVEGSVQKIRQAFIDQKKLSNPGVRDESIQLAVDLILNRELPEKYLINFE